MISRARLRLVVVGCVAALPVFAVKAHAQDDYSLPVFQMDFGGVGLMQTPTSRMAPVGEFSFTYDQIDPYTHYGFSLQPFEWMEAGFRYTQIDNRRYASSTDRDRDYLDKGVDLKLRLLKEGRYMPNVALGFRDLGGTGLFGSEYFVANKRWFDFDFSLGIGWGYLGSSDNIHNPLGYIADRFDTRQGDSGTGDFNVKQLFSGPTSLFAGVQYQTPFEPLTLQLEYDANDYKHEPLNNPQDQDSPINVGARYRVNDNLTLSAAWERGNTAMLGATLHFNMATVSQPKSDPPPVVPTKKPPAEMDNVEWNGIATRLSKNAGIRTKRISRDGDTLIVEGEASKYRSLPKSELRANRILHNVADSDITSFRYRWKNEGFYLREDVLPRAPLPDEPLLVDPASPFSDDDYRYGVESRPSSAERVAQQPDETLYESSGSRFSWNFTPGLNQNYGGPDGYLYQLLARLDTQFKTDEHGWFSSTLAYTLADNFDEAEYVTDSKLPRVRTDITKYLDETDVGLYNLQYTRTARLSDDWFGMAYAGYLEMMYAGVGGEVLYRPFNSAVAFGVDANWVRQRDYDTEFGLRDYDTWVGNATAYIDTGIKDVLARISVGRYLAKDIGTTIDLSRQFDSGIRLGAYATFTDAGDDYGEGSFDKGIYISMPLDIFFTKSSRRSAGLAWRPLTRDGGARLARRYSLYGLTGERTLGDYWQQYQDGVR